ncbi:ABC transporter permease [Paracoccus aminophilus]|uniref:ABC-type multidrug transport system, permease component n=1 Tax=Paracoccus aminophilus JCM 7686 TaxID=1367847 RepID=S5YHK1_PARAH|nr:ABC transporter permease [Paracoccus aminophilus]AGT10938.1 ABC-type multidrug transport system, permease component [Paracoccus aminophilus JCM 7686]
MSRSRILALMQSQFIEMRRDFGAMFLTFLFPLFFVVILTGSALVRSNPTFDFGFVDQTKSAEAQQFADALASQNIAIKTYSDEATLRSALTRRDVTAAVILPEGWTPTATGPRVRVVADTTTAGLAETVVNAARAKIKLGQGETADAIPFEMTTVEGSNAEFNFIYPGMLALALVQMGLFMTATPILKARERGTLRYILLTPTTTRELVVSQVLFRVLIASVQLTLLLAAGAFIITLSPSAWLATFGISILGTIMLVSIGYALAGIARSTESGMALIMIANFAMLFGGNVFWNPEGSAVLTAVARIMPVSYLADAYRQIISGAQGLWPIWQDIAMMLGFTLLALLIANRTFTFDMRSRDVQAQRA